MEERAKYIADVAEVFDRIGIDDDYTNEGIAANVDVWLSNKSALFNLLRKHPNWDEDAKAIILRNKEYRQVNVSDRTDWMGELLLMHPSILKMWMMSEKLYKV